MATEIGEDLLKARRAVYNEGYLEGYEEGCVVTRTAMSSVEGEGYNKGHKRGYEEGHERGYEVGTHQLEDGIRHEREKLVNIIELLSAALASNRRG